MHCLRRILKACSHEKDKKTYHYKSGISFSYFSNCSLCNDNVLYIIMAKDKPTPIEQVNQYIEKLPVELAKLAQAIREAILETDTEVGEHIKWNSPAFYYTGDMKPFDPKE